MIILVLKGVIIIRKPFNTPVDTEIQTEFKNKCKQQGIKYNDAIEAMMQAFIEGKIKINKKTILDIICEENAKI